MAERFTCENSGCHSANPHANGGLLRRPLRLPDFRDYAQDLAAPAQDEAYNTRPLGRFLRDVMARNMDNFRVFGPDENTSNKLDAIYEVSKKLWLADYLPDGTAVFWRDPVRLKEQSELLDAEMPRLREGRLEKEPVLPSIGELVEPAASLALPLSIRSSITSWKKHGTQCSGASMGSMWSEGWMTPLGAGSNSRIG